jgi:hypothetical protein
LRSGSPRDTLEALEVPELVTEVTAERRSGACKALGDVIKVVVKEMGPGLGNVEVVVELTLGIISREGARCKKARGTIQEGMVPLAFLQRAPDDSRSPSPKGDGEVGKRGF